MTRVWIKFLDSGKRTEGRPGGFLSSSRIDG